MSDTMHGETWDRIVRIKGWLDENAGDLTERERTMMRVLKIGEEFGEVAEALHGALGSNPRKGSSHTWEDVTKELVDVAVTTLVALATIDPDGAKTLDARLTALVDRIPAS
ncbi:MazG-like family protein [Streptomyces sp. H27-H5]|uniref:MazG-like family protein n=1 Tax=Streptomyces sp. H27-H5 TaxID=2996460 RepID=UPI0022717484|nr:MazG-like family protein [Streptomyces sp. H27-H5]MCY0961933.1 MazG-like family protein [Streptomyces sp. H27-H5]